MPRYELIKEEIASIAKYVPGKSIDDIVKAYGLDPASVIKLGSNENPLGPSPKAVEALIKDAQGISIYPSADARELVEAISEYTGIPADHIVASGPGMDGLLDGLTRLVISRGDEVILTTPTFSYYEISARANGAVPAYVQREEDFSVDVEKVLDAITPRTKIIFLCSPNNPSGNVVPEEDILRIAEATEALVFVDEAYVEFSDKNIAHLVPKYDNIIVGRTFSKAFGLAGMRIGYGMLPIWLKEEYMKIATPFNVSSAAVAAGVAALSDTEHLNKSIELARTGKKYLQDNIPFKVYDTQANFILVDVAPHKARDVTTELLKKGIIVRDCTSFANAGDSLIRITIGTEEQNKKVVEGFTSI
ncbi:histidinol phosphate aminotransferase apoenzyme [Methanococcoides vulcani]|uniref:Histidinol-phosphate aminotransferase n=1 Tax=Methanococcoides vulcani TaxID=1353158 RepID=A0A1H9ZE28_9EURY|nr:histidinol-phosphate transaminase [Methanococcoides vulcani]SES79842.1 histidinol phosphate aminotransferase apoenzyme [Methanococcoides vulcani]